MTYSHLMELLYDMIHSCVRAHTHTRTYTYMKIVNLNMYHPVQGLRLN